MLITPYSQTCSAANNFHCSSDRCADPSGNHISVHGRLPPHSNSAHHMHSHGHTSNIPPMNSGTWLYARIHLLIKRQAIIVSFSDEGNEQSGEGSKFETVLSIKNIDIREYLGGDIEAWVGFTASTGGLSQSHQVKLGSVNYLARDSSI
jgi:peptide-N4-(N-acetyl-beta-glucosaminyl)asparagine amidase